MCKRGENNRVGLIITIQGPGSFNDTKQQKQAITMVSKKNRDHHLLKEVSLQRAIIDTTATQEKGNHKLIPAKTKVTQLT